MTDYESTCFSLTLNICGNVAGEIEYETVVKEQTV